VDLEKAMADELEVLSLISEEGYPTFLKVAGTTCPESFEDWQILTAKEQPEFRDLGRTIVDRRP
jgi:hypothetical protein